MVRILHSLATRLGIQLTNQFSSNQSCNHLVFHPTECSVLFFIFESCSKFFKIGRKFEIGAMPGECLHHSKVVMHSRSKCYLVMGAV